MTNFYLFFLFLASLPQVLNAQSIVTQDKPTLVILGTTQDAGSPQIGCTKDCCLNLHTLIEHERWVSSIGLIIPNTKSTYLFDASPDISSQLQFLTNSLPFIKDSPLPEGIFLTHAHIGHYTGLMFLGREAFGAHQVPVYTMPRMQSFLQKNGPWSQLIELQNISLQPIYDQKFIKLSDEISVKPVLVPHRDEFSETVGYQIIGQTKSALFIPDIDKWDKWEHCIDSLILEVDYAFLDATFFDQTEIPNRDMSEIPHPFIKESMARFEAMDANQKAKIYFIHMNHSNPALDPTSQATKQILSNGFHVARKGMKFSLN